MGIEDELERGHAAFADRRWAEAFRRFAAAPPDSLSGPDLERLATAAYLVGEDEDSIAGWARAHQRHLDDGQQCPAARCAFWAGFQLANRGDMAQAGGWFGRAERIVQEVGDCAEAGYLLLPAGLHAFGAGDTSTAHGHFATATEIGRRFGDVDLVTFGQLGCGQVRIRDGDVEVGLHLLDEAMVAVTAEEVAATVAGIVYCAVIEACQMTFHIRRAHEWTDALTRWCERQPDLVPYRGQCLVHRAEILQVHGSWSAALDEVRRACERLSHPAPQPALGAACYQRAELHRLRGEFEDAAEAYALASRWGRDPQPGLALLRLAEGDVTAASAAIRRVVGETQDRLPRARVLVAASEILLTAGDVAGAADAARELDEIAAEVDVPYLRAMADEALGAVLLAEDAPTDALARLRRAATAWQAVDAPREGARTRVLIALACRQLGDDDTAALELDVARQVFRDLGATVDLDRLESVAAGDAADHHGLTGRELEVLRLVSGGATNKAIAGELVLSERTVERHLSNIFAKLGVSTRSAATAFAYEHDLV